MFSKEQEQDRHRARDFKTGFDQEQARLQHEATAIAVRKDKRAELLKRKRGTQNKAPAFPSSTASAEAPASTPTVSAESAVTAAAPTNAAITLGLLPHTKYNAPSPYPTNVLPLDAKSACNLEAAERVAKMVPAYAALPGLLRGLNSAVPDECGAAAHGLMVFCEGLPAEGVAPVLGHCAVEPRIAYLLSVAPVAVAADLARILAFLSSETNTPTYRQLTSGALDVLCARLTEVVSIKTENSTPAHAALLENGLWALHNAACEHAILASRIVAKGGVDVALRAITPLASVYTLQSALHVLGFCARVPGFSKEAAAKSAEAMLFLGNINDSLRVDALRCLAEMLAGPNGNAVTRVIMTFGLAPNARFDDSALVAMSVIKKAAPNETPACAAMSVLTNLWSVERAAETRPFATRGVVGFVLHALDPSDGKGAKASMSKGARLLAEEAALALSQLALIADAALYRDVLRGAPLVERLVTRYGVSPGPRLRAHLLYAFQALAFNCDDNVLRQLCSRAVKPLVAAMAHGSVEDAMIALSALTQMADLCRDRVQSDEERKVVDQWVPLWHEMRETFEAEGGADAVGALVAQGVPRAEQLVDGLMANLGLDEEYQYKAEWDDGEEDAASTSFGTPFTASSSSSFSSSSVSSPFSFSSLNASAPTPSPAPAFGSSSSFASPTPFSF
jgi:hypothetical protein